MQARAVESRFFPLSNEPTPEELELAELIETTISALEDPAGTEKARILSDFINKFKTSEHDGYACELIFPALKCLPAKRQIYVYLGMILRNSGSECISRVLIDLFQIRSDYSIYSAVGPGANDSRYNPLKSAESNLAIFYNNHVVCSELNQLYSFFHQHCSEYTKCRITREIGSRSFQCGLLLCADNSPPSPYDYMKCGSFYAYHGRDAEAIACYRLAIATKVITPFSDDVRRAFGRVDAYKKPDLNQMEGLLRDKTLCKLIEAGIGYLCQNPDDEHFYEAFTLSLLKKNKSAVASALLLLPPAMLYPLLNEIFSIAVNPNPLRMSLWRQRGMHPCESTNGSLNLLHRQYNIMLSVKGSDEDLLTHEQLEARARRYYQIGESSLAKKDEQKARAMKPYDSMMQAYMERLNSYYSLAGILDDIHQQTVALIRDFTLNDLSEKFYNIALCNYVLSSKFNSNKESDRYLADLIYNLHQCHELRPIKDIFTSKGAFLPGKKRLRVSEPYSFVVRMSPENVLSVIESLDDFMQIEILNSCLDDGRGLWKEFLAPAQPGLIKARVEALKASRKMDYLTVDKVKETAKVKLLAAMIRWFDIYFSLGFQNLDIYKCMPFVEYIFSHSADEVLAALAMLTRERQLAIYQGVINRNGWMVVIRNQTSNFGIPAVMACRREILEFTNCKNDDEFTVDDWSHFVTKTRVGEFDVHKILYACKRIMELAPESDYSILNFYFFASVLDHARADITLLGSNIHYYQRYHEVTNILKDYIHQHPECRVPHLVLAMILYVQALTGEVMYHYCKSGFAGSSSPRILALDRGLPIKLRFLTMNQFTSIERIVEMNPEKLFTYLTSNSVAPLMQKYVLREALNGNDVYHFLPALRDKVEARLNDLDQQEKDLMDFVVIEENANNDAIDAPYSQSPNLLFARASQVFALPQELQELQKTDRAHVDSIFEL